MSFMHVSYALCYNKHYNQMWDPLCQLLLHSVASDWGDPGLRTHIQKLKEHS